MSSEVTVPVAYVAGVSVALISTLISATGLTLQKRTHKRLEREKEAAAATAADASTAAPDSLPVPSNGAQDTTLVQSSSTPKKQYYKQASWLAGVSCMLASALMSLAVFALLGQARSSALAAMTIVWNGLLAKAFLNEVFTGVDALSSILVILGALIAVIFGANGAQEQAGKTIDDLVDSLHRTTVVIAAVVIVLVYIGAYLFLRRMRQWEVAGTRTDGQKRATCFVRVALAALFSGSTGMLSKNVVVCLVQLVGSRSPYVLTRFEFYFFVASLPASLVLQLGYLNGALREMDALEVVPPYQARI